MQHTISDESIEALKWIGLILMTIDHVNKYLFNATLPMVFEAGRLCLPIFVFVLAYNLARPGSFECGAFQRVMKRLVLFGTLASVPFIALGGLLGGWWPLNILFTLAVLTAVVFLIEKGGPLNLIAAVTVFLIGGSIVEYCWPALALGLFSWVFFKKLSVAAAIAVILACASLWVINQNFWALAALPVILGVSFVEVPIPRLKWLFYAYYPLHLTVLWFIRIPMSKAGYLFF